MVPLVVGIGNRRQQSVTHSIAIAGFAQIIIKIQIISFRCLPTSRTIAVLPLIPAMTSNADSLTNY